MVMPIMMMTLQEYDNEVSVSITVSKKYKSASLVLMRVIPSHIINKNF